MGLPAGSGHDGRNRCTGGCLQHLTQEGGLGLGFGHSGDRRFGRCRLCGRHACLGGSQRFCARLEVLHFDENAAFHAADISAQLSKAGQKIGAYDSLIAGHARSLGLIIVTHNLREFARVDGLRCEDWQEH